MSEQRPTCPARLKAVLTGPHPPSRAWPPSPANPASALPADTPLRTQKVSGCPRASIPFLGVPCPRPLSRGHACCPCHLSSQRWVYQDGSDSAGVAGCQSPSVSLSPPVFPFLANHCPPLWYPGVQSSPPTYNSDYPSMSSEGFSGTPPSPALPLHPARCQE